MRASAPLRTALAGVVALLVAGELVARLHGDRLCTDHPGVIYERDAALGWRHVPQRAGWVGTCDGDGVPATPLAIDADGRIGPSRPGAKAPGTARVLLLGGNVPEGFGVPQDDAMARVLELYADERRGARLEVENGATGGWAIDNSLAFFRRSGAARAPDLVLLVIDPVADLVSISPAHLAARGRRVPAKPFFSLVDGRVEPTPPFALAPVTPPPPPLGGPLAWSQLYRLLRGRPQRIGEPMAWAASGTFPHGSLDGERERSVELARGLLGTLRDEVAAAGGRLVAVIAALPGAAGRDATGQVERERLTAVAADLGIPLLDLTYKLVAVERWGRPLYLTDSVRLTGSGHALAAAEIWSFLRAQGLLPAGVVPAATPGSGHAMPGVAELPRVVGETLWASRNWLVGRILQFGLLAVGLVWLTAPLPSAARDWLLAGLGVTMLWVLGSRDAAILGAALGLAWYGAVELLPPIPATAVAMLLGIGLIVAMGWSQAMHVPGEPWAVPVFLALATNVALLKLIAYAVDRRRGSPRLRLREFLAGMLFFPTLPAGPIESPDGFAARRAAGAVAPSPRDAVAALARLTWGWLQVTVPPLFLILDNTEVFAGGGAAVGRPRLWLFVGEVALLSTLLLSGWSDIAIGFGRLVGTSPPENLRQPWRASDVAEFWRRWHATLTDWLRNYVYLPLGGARRSAARNVALVFLASALWHGWAISKTLGWSGFPPRAWRGVLLCAVANAAAVGVAHAIGRRGGAPRGPLDVAWRVAATWVFVALAWLPLLLPQWNRLADLGGVYLRLFFLR